MSQSLCPQCGGPKTPKSKICGACARTHVYYARMRDGERVAFYRCGRCAVHLPAGCFETVQSDGLAHRDFKYPWCRGCRKAALVVWLAKVKREAPMCPVCLERQVSVSRHSKVEEICRVCKRRGVVPPSALKVEESLTYAAKKVGYRRARTSEDALECWVSIANTYRRAPYGT